MHETQSSHSSAIFDPVGVQKKLSQVSDSFCLVKWKNSTINLSSRSVRSCCHDKFKPLEDRVEGMAFNDTRKDQEIRSSLLKGEKPEACNACWWRERGGTSHRIAWSGQGYLMDFFSQVSNHRAPTALAPSWLEIVVSPKCNLKCAYCSPEHSSQWKEDIEKFGAFPTHPVYGALDYYKREERYPYQELDPVLESRFWNWYDSIYGEMRLLTLTGGEPLLSSQTFSILEKVLQKPNPKLILAINTNLSVPREYWSRFMDLVQRLEKQKAVAMICLQPSMETFGSRAEYIRFGLKQELFRKNVVDYLDNTNGNLVFTSSISNLAVSGLLKHWQYVHFLKKKFPKRWISSTSDLVRMPEWFRVSILPESFQNYVEECHSYLSSHLTSKGGVFSSEELDGLNDVLQVMRSSEKEEDLVNFRTNFHRFFKEYDIRRKTDLRKTFPEYGEFFDLCEGQFFSVHGQ